MTAVVAVCTEVMVTMFLAVVLAENENTSCRQPMPQRFNAR
jgi:hypothetical protein